MRYSNISDLYKQVQERKLTPQELEDREKIAKKLPMDDFKKRYGKDAMAVKMAVATNIAKGKSEEVVKEDGHQDIPSAIRQCKTITEDAMQIMSKLQGMNPEESLPTWWTNKLAVASNSMNKMRDYLLVPSMREQIELDEKAGDIPDLKNLVGELQNASKLHLAQSKRVQAHVDMMDKANAKGPEGSGGIQDLKKIVGELEKASQAHLRQSKSIDAHVKFMGEAINEQPEHEIKVGNYTTKHFYMCGSAQTTMKKHADKEGAEELTRMQDVFYKMEKDAMDAGGASDEQKKKSQILYDKIIAKAKEVGIANEVDKYMKMHLNSMLKGDPKLGFGRTDVKNEDTTMNKDLVDAVTKIMMGEKKEVNLSENIKSAFDKIIKSGGVDKKDFEKAKDLYMKKDLMGLKKHIRSLDTAPLEAVMDVISQNDDKAFMKMYPKSKRGQPMTVIAKEDNTNDKSDDGEGLDKVQPKALKKKFKDRKDKDIDNDGDVDSTDKYLHTRRKAVSKAISKENYEIGKDYGKHTREVTPGQSNDDFNKMVDVMQKKNNSMREALAKVWNTTEGKNPFQKTEGEHENSKKTMTGKKPTKVEVDPEVKETKK